MRDLSLHILDIVENSVKAKASVIEIILSADTEDRELKLEISDNGIGMDEDFLMRVEDPFTTTRTTRKVGLGIPLLKESTLKCDGKFKIYSTKNVGTRVIATFLISHIDRLPMGSISETMIALISANPNIQFVLFLCSGNGDWKLDTEEIKKVLDGVGIGEFAVLQWLKEYIDEGVKNIFGGVLNEIDS